MDDFYIQCEGSRENCRNFKTINCQFCTKNKALQQDGTNDNLDEPMWEE
jgi:hypothetical protein